MNWRFFLLSFIVLIVCVLFFIFFQKSNKSEISIDGKTFFVDLATTSAEQERGLSGRTSLAPHSGMLFVFNTPGRYGFWMKDMNFPLDIVWIDQNFHITFIEHSLASSTYPTVYYPEAPASYVLEISAGETNSLNISVGDSVQFLKK